MGKASDNYWLPDSGTTAHMTPHISDLDAGSFKPHSGSIRVANNHCSTVISRGNVTLLIRCYCTGKLISWTLHDVLVVPTLTKRLISTDALNIFNHEVQFLPDCVILYYANVLRKTTVLKLPKYFERNNSTGEYHWPQASLASCTKDTRPAIFVALILDSDIDGLPTNNHSYAATTENVTAIPENLVTNVLCTTNKKRNVNLQLMHHCLGHCSVESLFLGNSDNIWNDVTVQKDPETVCETCQITLARRAPLCTHLLLEPSSSLCIA
jgi:hypothetical protein